MRQDIKRALKESQYEKIITKHEWMIAALLQLEGEDLPRGKEESPSQLYEMLFIDPS